jgi:hypothetical protein
MWRNILGQVVYQIAIFMNLLFLTPGDNYSGTASSLMMNITKITSALNSMIMILKIKYTEALNLVANASLAKYLIMVSLELRNALTK